MRTWIFLDVDGCVSPLGSIPESQQYPDVPDTGWSKMPMRSSVADSLRNWSENDNVVIVWSSMNEENSNAIMETLGLPECDYVNVADYDDFNKFNAIEDYISSNVPDGELIVWIDDENAEEYKKMIAESPIKNIHFIECDGNIGLSDNTLYKINSIIDGEKDNKRRSTMDNDQVMELESTTGIATLLEKAERIREEHIREGLDRKEQILNEASQERDEILNAAKNDAEEIKANAHKEADEIILLARQEAEEIINDLEVEELDYKNKIAYLMKMESNYRNALNELAIAGSSAAGKMARIIDNVEVESSEMMSYLDVDQMFDEEDGFLVSNYKGDTLPDTDGDDESYSESTLTVENDTEGVPVPDSVHVDDVNEEVIEHDSSIDTDEEPHVKEDGTDIDHEEEASIQEESITDEEEDLAEENEEKMMQEEMLAEGSPINDDEK